jgi:hypothetical protein
MFPSFSVDLQSLKLKLKLKFYQCTWPTKQSTGVVSISSCSIQPVEEP